MFKRTLLATALACALPLPALASGDAQLAAEVAKIRAEFDQKLQEIQSAYEARLKALESRQAQTAPAPVAAVSERQDKLGQVGSGSSFNPQISVIFDGVYYNDNKKGGGIEAMEHIDGITHGHNHEGHNHAEMGRGFNLRETEIVFSATVSPYFDANLMLTVDSGGGVAIEEAFFDTRALPGGLKIRGGKFLSGIGYLNSQHPHTWDFVDQNLAYGTLLGHHGLMDTGLQFTWLPKTGNLYTLLGMELLQGNEHNFVSGGKELPGDMAGVGFGEMGADKAGPRLMTAYAKFGPDLGDTHALQFGASYAKGRQLQEVHDHRAENPAASVHGLDGDGWLWGADVVYKFDAPGAYGKGDFTLAAEYLRQRKDLSVAFHQTNAAAVGGQRKFTQDGFYIQGVYGFAPNWQAGVRYDVTGMTSEVDRGTSVSEWDKSDRWTVSLTRHLTEFSRLRLQASTADLSVEGSPERVNQYFLQYQHSLGAHGAHKF